MNNTTINTNGTKMYNEERREAESLINVENLHSYLYMKGYEVIGTKRTKNGEVPTTLEEQVLEVVRLAHKAYIADGINYYDRRAVNRTLLLSAEELAAYSENAYKKAAAKLIWISSKSKAAGFGFITRNRIDKENLEECQKVVDAFEFLIRNYNLAE